jgi:hypothetical protein
MVIKQRKTTRTRQAERVTETKMNYRQSPARNAKNTRKTLLQMGGYYCDMTPESRDSEVRMNVLC